MHNNKGKCKFYFRQTEFYEVETNKKTGVNLYAFFEVMYTVCQMVKTVCSYQL
jgi:hypothetical protein